MWTCNCCNDLDVEERAQWSTVAAFSFVGSGFQFGPNYNRVDL